jgi:hypothetical protein
MTDRDRHRPSNEWEFSNPEFNGQNAANWRYRH